MGRLALQLSLPVACSECLSAWPRVSECLSPCVSPSVSVSVLLRINQLAAPHCPDWSSGPGEGALPATSTRTKPAFRTLKTLAANNSQCRSTVSNFYLKQGFCTKLFSQYWSTQLYKMWKVPQVQTAQTDKMIKNYTVKASLQKEDTSLQEVTFCRRPHNLLDSSLWYSSIDSPHPPPSVSQPPGKKKSFFLVLKVKLNTCHSEYQLEAIPLVWDPW